MLQAAGPAWSSVTLYLIAAGTDKPVANEYLENLAKEEIERSRRFVRPADRRRFTLCRAKVRMLLAHHLECSPKHVPLVFDDYGKPHLAGNELAINWSNSAEMALLGVATCRAIGVDIEHMRIFEDMDGVARSHFCADEWDRYHGASRRDQRAREFYRIWTLKEAYIKAVGHGLSIPLTSFSVLDSRGLVRAPTADYNAWSDSISGNYSVAAMTFSPPA